MAAPERVNVLLSRARDALIMIGNADTFMNSRKGRDVWVPLMTKLKREGHVYDGFPVQCENHPDRKGLLATKEDFERLCPDGGCSEPWHVSLQIHAKIFSANARSGVMLSCKQHTCPQRCHQLQDHSKMLCQVPVESKCPQHHKIIRKCHDKSAMVCRKCDAETRAREKRIRRDYELDKARQEKQRAYAAQLAELDSEIEHHKRMRKDQAEAQDRQNVLEQRRKDLADLKASAQKPRTNSKESTPPNSTPSMTASAPSSNANKQPANVRSSNKATAHVPTAQETSGGASAPPEEELPDQNESEAKDDWKWQKEYEGAENEALDSLIAMIGKQLGLTRRLLC